MNEKATDFRDLETRLHRKEVRNSREAVADLLADDFIEFTRSGKVADKKGIIESLTRETADLRMEVEDFSARPLAPDLVLVTYRSVRPDSLDGKLLRALRSSIWRNEGGKWRMVFHQGTATG